MTMQRYCGTVLEEKSTLCPEEREFMLAWNYYTHKHPILADYQMPTRCIEFANEHRKELADPGGSFFKCFTAHLMNLLKFRLLTPTELHKTMLAVKRNAVEGAAGK